MGKPLGEGLRSLVKITGGYIEYQSNSHNVQPLIGLINTITDGAIYRDDDGRLVAYIATMSLHTALQKFNESLDLHKMVLRSEDSTLSGDASRPTVLHSTTEVILPKGSEALDLRDWTTAELLQDIKIRIETYGKGILLDKEFSGDFDASYFFFGLAPTVSVSGRFKIDLA